MIVIIVVLVLALLGMAYLFWGKNLFTKVSPTPTPQPTTTVSPGPTMSPGVTPTPSATKTPAPTATPKKMTVTVGSSSELDGFRSSNGGGNATLEIRAGRNSNLVTRGFVSFKIPSELSGKNVVKATLRLYQGEIVGDPYGAGGTLKVDHLDYGSSLENADYSVSSLSSNFATLTANESLEWKDVNVKDRLIEDLANGRTYSQYRIHFSTENIGGDVTGDFTYFESQNNSMGTGNTPQLVIEYQ